MALQSPSGTNQTNLNKQLLDLSDRTGADHIFILNTDGETIASSNFDTPDNFIGQNFAFRPYFKETLMTGDAQVFAIGERTGKAGLFLTSRIGPQGNPIGAVVVKVEFADLIRRWDKLSPTIMVADSDGIILFSNEETLNYGTLRVIPAERQAEIQASRQFGGLPLKPVDLVLGKNAQGEDWKGKRVVFDRVALDSLDWEFIKLDS